MATSRVWAENAPPPPPRPPTAAGYSQRSNLSTADFERMAKPGSAFHFTLNAGAPFLRAGGRGARAEHVDQVRLLMSEAVALTDAPREAKRRARDGAGVAASLAPPATIVPCNPPSFPRSRNPLQGESSEAHRSGRRRFEQASVASQDCIEPSRKTMPRKAKPALDMATVVGSLLVEPSAARHASIPRNDHRVCLRRPPPRVY